MLDRHHLLILQSIAQHGTLTQAADELCLTQSALSHSIKKLEDTLQVKLWQRNGRNILLTHTGHYLLHAANRLLPQFTDLENKLRQCHAGHIGQIRLGIECHPCYKWLIKRLPTFLENYHEVDIDIKQRFQFGGIAALLHHEIDLLITPDPIDNPHLNFIKIFEYELMLVCAATHDLAQHTHVTPALLKPYVLYTYPVPIERLDIYSQFLLPAQCLPKQHKTLEATDIMVEMVASQRGVCAMPDWLYSEYQINHALKAIRLGHSGLHKGMFIAIRKNEQQPVIHTFIQHLRQ